MSTDRETDPHPFAAPGPVTVTGGPREKSQSVAEQIRRSIIDGELNDGDSLGREQDIIERFAVSRPTVREALRILEAEGLVTVLRGVHGGVVVRVPDRRTTARAAALVLHARNTSLADVVETRLVIEPGAVRLLTESRRHAHLAHVLHSSLREQGELVDDPEAFNAAAARFSAQLVALTGVQTLMMVSETLDEVVARAVAALPERVQHASVSTRRRTLRSQERLLHFIGDGDADAAARHWRAHLSRIQRYLLQHTADTRIDMAHHR